MGLKNACKLHTALKKLNFQSSGRKIAPVWAGLDLVSQLQALVLIRVGYKEGALAVIGNIFATFQVWTHFL